MTPALVILAGLVAAGGVVAVSAREPRFAALGMLVALIGGAFVVDPLPDAAALAARTVGSVLAAYLVWVALRGAPPPTTGWQVGWPGATAIAIVGFAIGWLAAGSIGTALSVTDGEGPTVGAASALAAGSFVSRAALGAALALGALATAPVLVGRDVLRLGLGLLLLVAAAGLLRSALGTGPDAIEELAIAVLTAISGAAVAGLVGRSLSIHGDLLLRIPQRDAANREQGPRHRPTDEAHPRHLGPGGRLPREHGPGAHPVPGREQDNRGGIP